MWAGDRLTRLSIATTALEPDCTPPETDKLPACRFTPLRAFICPRTSIRPARDIGTSLSRIALRDGAVITLPGPNMASIKRKVGVTIDSRPTLTIPLRPTTTP